MGPDLTATIQPFLDRRPAGLSSEFHIHHMGGAIDDVAPADSVYSGRGAPYVWNITTRWESPHDTDENVTWARDLGAALEPFSTGQSYVNFIGDADRVRAAYSPETYARLVQVKDRFDPENVFRLNQNIVPSGS
jgi:FAD/FMN-containing dehydrogenase